MSIRDARSDESEAEAMVSAEDEATFTGAGHQASETFDAAVLTVRDAPGDLRAWVALEHLATAHHHTEQVAALYRDALAMPLAPSVVVALAERAIRYHDEWVEGPELVAPILTRALEAAPTTVWALDRAALLFTTLARWSDLLALYDRAIAAEGDAASVGWLEDAAHVAKDCAGDVDRAVGYLERLVELDRNHEENAAALERLLSQQGRFADLITLWTRRAEVLPPAEAVAMRERIAVCRLESLQDATGALATIEPLLREPVAADAACAVIERILVARATPSEVRRDALDRLRAHYDAAHRHADVVRVLEAALALTSGRDRVDIHAELARRMVERGHDEAAVDHLAALLVLDPASSGDDVLLRLLAPKFTGTLGGCSPKLDRSRGRELLHRAAKLATSTPGSRERAVHLYRVLIKDTPRDQVAITRFATVLETSGERAELRTLRRHELTVTDDLARRLELRLDVSRLSEALGDPRGREEALRENLKEQPDHRRSIEEIIAALEGEGRLADLCDLLSEQAQKLEASGDGPLAAELWAKAASIAETGLKALRRAVQGYERVVALTPGPAPLDALARIHGELGEHDAAVACLERCLTLTPEDAKTDVLRRLALAYVASGRREDALGRLEAGLEVDPAAQALRSLLTELLRADKDWERLVSALLDGAKHATGEARLAFLLDAAELLSRELKTPERAVPLFEQAVAEGARDASVRAELADALRRVGRLDEARALAESLVAAYGRRRPADRAAVHLTLARTLRTQGDVGGATEELESAVSIDMGNASAQRLLGELCRETGAFERAERAYQALLLIQKRQRAHGAEPPTAHGVSETLFHLHGIAQALGDAGRAAETLASAFDVARRSEHEAARLERVLRKAGARDLLLRALEQRLATTSDPAVRSAVLGEVVGLLDALDRPGDALDRAIAALDLAPDDTSLHERARALSTRAGQVQRYVSALRAMVDTASQSGRPAEASAHLLRLGAVYEDDLRELDSAAQVYERAEATSENLLEVWRRMVRVAGARGDHGTRLAVLRRLADALSDGGAAEERADVLYALADEELQAASTVEAGLSSLASALALHPQPVVAARALRKALRIAPEPEPVAVLYVQVARSTGDKAALLDALTAQSQLPAPPQDLLEEAHGLALELGSTEQAKRLLERSVEAAVDPGDALWAMRALAKEREGASDLPAAIGWMMRAADVAGEVESSELLTRVGRLAAGPVGDLDLALRVYERLRDRDVGNPSAWGPWLDVLRAMDDPARLESALDRAIEVIPAPKDRNRVRLERARLLMRWPDRQADLTDVLRAAIDEEPDHEEAATLLADLLERRGEHQELADLLGRRLDAARDREDADAGVAIAGRLAGDHLKAGDRGAAADVYRSVLEWARQRSEPLRALVALLTGDDETGERADLLERLVACESGAERFDLALELARARQSLVDPAGVERALAVAWATDPGHPELRGRLRSLADATVADASDHPKEAGPLLFKAAVLLHDRVGDSAAALDVLRKAVAAEPDDAAALDLLVRCAIETRDLEGAAAAVSAAIGKATEPGDPRPALLRLRALVSSAAGDHLGAWGELEAAVVAGGDAFVPDMIAEAPHARQQALAEGDLEAERPLALRHAELLVRTGQADAACEVLAEWTGRAVDDRQAIRRLVELDAEAERWDDVAEGYARLLDLETPEDLPDVALAMADACERAGRAEAGCVGLERVFQSDPTHVEVRERLRALYQRGGRDRELSNLLLVEARQTEDAGVRFEGLRDAGRLRLSSLQEPAAAIGPLSEALDLRPNDQPVTLLLADAYVAAGLVDEATDLLRSAIAQRGNKRSRELSELQHRMAGLADNRAAELSWLVAAFESFPKGQEICTDLARVATEQGQYETALKGLRSLVSIKDATPQARASAYLMQARIASLQSDDRRAVFLAKKALGEDPKFADATAFIEEVERRP